MDSKYNSVECSAIIDSEEYADYLVEYNGTISQIIQRYDPPCIQLIDNKFAVIHSPVPKDLSTMIDRYGYESIPKCYALLDSSSMEASGVLKLQRQPYLDLYGSDVIVGIIDTGIDYTHPVFLNADGTSRIIKIWDQTRNKKTEKETSYLGEAPGFLRYGTEYTKEMLDKALQADDPFSVVPTKDEEGHGTFMAGIAAGNYIPEEDFTGAAPLADIAVVKLKQAKQYLKEFFYIKEDAICYQENDIMLAIRYLLETSIKELKTLVICIGIGTNAGDHNGNSHLDEYLNNFADRVGEVAVVAAGNETNLSHHYSGVIAAKQDFEDVEIKVGERERGFTIELWAETPDLFAIGLISPSGEFVPRISPRLNAKQTISFLLEPTKVYVNYSILEARTGDQLILMRFQNPVAGIWKIRVFNEGVTNNLYHMWLPMEGLINKDTVFLKPDPNVTLSNLATSANPIVVSTYNHTNDSIYIHSSRGYTRGGRIKPDIAAPGVDVFGPLPNKRYGRRTGSSIAAAHVAGGSALLLEWGINDRNDLNMDSPEIAKFLIRGARRGDQVYPNREWGYGAFDIYQTFETLRTTL